MRLLVISGAFPPMASGEAANTFHLCRRLVDAGVEVHLLTTQQPNIEQIDGVNLHPIMQHWSWRETGRLRRVIRGVAPDAILLIHLAGIYNNHPMISFAPTLAKRALPGVRFVTRFENPMFALDKKPSLMSRALRKAAATWAGADGCSYAFGTLLRDSDAVIALCGYHLERLGDESREIESKGVLIPPPANVSVMADSAGTLRTRGRNTIGASADAFVVGYLGYLYPIKGVETLLRAIALLVSHKVTVRLVIIGGSAQVAGADEGIVSYYDQMRQLAAELGLGGLTIWVGAFSAVNADVAGYIHAADAFVLPFDNGIHLNNSSLATLASYGVPVVTTREHTDRALVDQENVLLCPPRDPAAIADAISKLIKRPELATKLRLGALALARDYFNWDTALQRTLNCLQASATNAPYQPNAVDVSVVVATCNRSENLPLLLDALLHSESPGLIWDVWVVDNNSKDGTAALVAAYAQREPRVHYVFEATQGKSHALNHGVREASGNIIAFTDDDCIPDRHWIANINAAFAADSKLGLAGGRVELFNSADHPTTTRTGRARRTLTSPSDAFSSIIGCNMAGRRELLRAIGDFDPLNCPGSSSDAVSEDADFVYRAFKAGVLIEYRPDILVHHNHGRRSDGDVTDLQRKYVRGRGSFYAKHIVKGDRAVLKMAYWEVRSTLADLMKKLLSGQSAREELRLISFLFAGAMTRFSK